MNLSNDAQIKLDMLLLGEAYTIDGIRVDPLRVTHRTPRTTRLPGLTRAEILDYEIRSSWWACLAYWGWAQSLAGRYFAWKVDRKWDRYQANLRKRSELKAGGLI